MKTVLRFTFYVLLLLTACTTPTSAPAQTFVIENTALPTGIVQFTPIPTLTPEVQATVQPATEFPTLTPLPAPVGTINVVQFNVNGTYADITDSIATGSSKRYSLSGMQGQIMSISILPQLADGGWGYIPMRIQGADGSVLCPQLENFECLFWRGALPSSQEYFVTLTPIVDVVQFVMRVAVNPPGQDVQYFQYNNPTTGLTLAYPDFFAPAVPMVGNYKIDPEFALYLIDSEAYQKTNLSEVYLFIGSTSNAQTVSTCTHPNQMGGAPEQIIGDEVIHEFTFVHSTSDGVAAGNYYEQQIYRMVDKEICYEVIYMIHSTNIGNYPPGTVIQFDRDAVIQKLNDVFSTFTIK